MSTTPGDGRSSGEAEASLLREAVEAVECYWGVGKDHQTAWTLDDFRVPSGQYHVPKEVGDRLQAVLLRARRHLGLTVRSEATDARPLHVIMAWAQENAEDTDARIASALGFIRHLRDLETDYGARRQLQGFISRLLMFKRMADESWTGGVREST